MNEPRDPKVTVLPVRKKDTERQFRIVDQFEQKCTHRGVTYEVCDVENEVVCGACRTRLNPIWVLKYLAMEESRFDSSRRAYLEAKKDHEKRVRCKCQHCGQMTRIRGM